MFHYNRIIEKTKKAMVKLQDILSSGIVKLYSNILDN